MLYGQSQPPIGGDIPLPVWHLTLRNNGALQKAGSPGRKKKKEKEKENEKENKISSFYAFSVLFCLVVSIFSLVIGLILAFIGNGEASYICAAIFGVSFAAFLLGSWWKTTSIASKADWSDWGWL